jgi:hypothetical protein
MRRVSILLAFCAIGACGHLLGDQARADGARKNAPSGKPGAAPAKGSYVIVWDFDATKAIPADTGEIIVPVPSDEPYLKVHWEISGVRTQRVVNVDGGRLAAVRPAGPTFRLRVIVEPTATDMPRSTGKTAMPADAAACLRDNAAFALRNPKTAKLAKELKAVDAEQSVNNIRNWLNENVTYQHQSLGEKFKQLNLQGGMDSIIDAKHCVCDGFSSLFVTLCRQGGVPARVLWGPVCVQGIMAPALPGTGQGPVDLGKMGDFCCHFWAEVFLDGRGWIPVEPQDPVTPLGQVPRNGAFPAVPVLRLPPEYDYFRDNAGIAVRNVNAMGWFARLEQPGNKPPKKR